MKDSLISTLETFLIPKFISDCCGILTSCIHPTLIFDTLHIHAQLLALLFQILDNIRGQNRLDYNSFFFFF